MEIIYLRGCVCDDTGNDAVILFIVITCGYTFHCYALYYQTSCFLPFIIVTCVSTFVVTPITIRHPTCYHSSLLRVLTLFVVTPITIRYHGYYHSSLFHVFTLFVVKPLLSDTYLLPLNSGTHVVCFFLSEIKRIHYTTNVFHFVTSVCMTGDRCVSVPPHPCRHGVSR